MYLKEVLKKYVEKNCTITTRNDEYDGVLMEVGDDFAEINDGDSVCFVNLNAIESVSFDE